MILSYGFHVIDTLMVLLAVVLEFVDIPETNLDLNAFLMFWNGSVVGIYGMIALGEVRSKRSRADSQRTLFCKLRLKSKLFFYGDSATLNWYLQ